MHRVNISNFSSEESYGYRALYSSQTVILETGNASLKICFSTWSQFSKSDLT